MVSVLNSTCARFDDVARSGSPYDLESALLYVKGTWLPSEFSIAICDGNDAWTGRATREFVVQNASRLGLKESEYVDRVHFYFSKQQPDAKYELTWSKNLSPDLVCYKETVPPQLLLRLQTTTDGGPRVAADMVQLLLDAHQGLTEEIAKKSRWYEREIAAKELSLTVLQRQIGGGNGFPNNGPNGHVNVAEEAEEHAARKILTAGTSSRAKRKGGASNTDTGSRKRKTSDALPLKFQKPLSPVPLLLSFKDPKTQLPLPLSALGYNKQQQQQQQPKIGGEEPSKDPSWLDTFERAGRNKEQSNGVTDDSISEGHLLGAKKAFLDRLSDVAEAKTDPLVTVKRSSKKKQGKPSTGKKSSKKALGQPSLDDSLDRVEDVVEKGIECVDNIVPLNSDAHEVSSPLTTPVKPARKTPASGKRPPKSEKKEKKEKKDLSSRPSSRKKAKPFVVELEEESESEPTEAPEIVAGPAPGGDEDREIDVQNAEFNDFDASRTESSFEVGQFWALYDDQDGMPRFYGHVTDVRDSPFQVSVEWLEPFKPNCPAISLVKSARLSPSCGEFTFGAECLQDLPAFSHLVEVDCDPKRTMVTFYPKKHEIWALYRHWDKKQAKKEDDGELSFEYDLVQVETDYSTTEGLSVVPVNKVEGFKSLFTVEGKEKSYNIPNKQIQARFSHRIPRHLMIGSESPGVPPGAWELDPASTPAEFLGTGAQEGRVDNNNAK